MAKKLAFDKVFFSAVLVLLALGLVMVYSASVGIARRTGSGFNPFLVKQSIAAIVGLAGMFLMMAADYRWLRRPSLAWGSLGVCLLLLVVVLFMPERNDTHRWIFYHGISIQPSELAKLGILFFVAYHLDRKPDLINRKGVLLPCGVATAMVLGLVIMEPDLSSAVLIGATVALLFFLAGLSWKYIALATGLVLPLIYLAVYRVPYRRTRFLSFLYPEADPLGSGFQAMQSLIAVGSGGLQGRGLGHSLQKLHFLPYPHSDYIFSIVAEELGLIGAGVFILIFGVMAWRGLQTGFRAPDDLGRYLAWGMVCLVFLQAMLHISVCLSLFPSTGVPLPLVTYGGSSMVVTLLACGVILNVSQHA